jgi:hypothetical protein
VRLSTKIVPGIGVSNKFSDEGKKSGRAIIEEPEKWDMREMIARLQCFDNDF